MFVVFSGLVIAFIFDNIALAPNLMPQTILTLIVLFVARVQVIVVHRGSLWYFVVCKRQSYLKYTHKFNIKDCFISLNKQ